MTDDRATQIQRLANVLHEAKFPSHHPVRVMRGSVSWEEAERMYDAGARIPDPPTPPAPAPTVQSWRRSDGTFFTVSAGAHGSLVLTDSAGSTFTVVGPPTPPAPEPEQWVVTGTATHEAVERWHRDWNMADALRAALPHLIAANRRRIVREMAERAYYRYGLVLNGVPVGVGDFVAALVPEEEKKGGGV